MTRGKQRKIIRKATKIFKDLNITAPPRHPAHDYDLILGIDTEYVRNNGLDTDPEADSQNRVLCYTVTIHNPRTDKRGSFMIELEGRSKKNRLSLSGLLGRAFVIAERYGFFDTKNKKIRELNGPKDSIKIALIGHWTRADLPSFRDFPKLKKRFDGPRGTFATTGRPSRFDVRLPGSGRSRAVSVRLYDTKLLAPAGFLSLKKLGAALGFNKLSLPDVVDESGHIVKGIQRMDLVLERHREEFTAYALRDAEIVVAWWLLVADYCYTNGIPQVPPTIGAISVKYILNDDSASLAAVLGRAIASSGKISKNPLPELASVQSLFADAFHGGRNECFCVGLYTSADLAGGIFTDLDEHGAYTTAMAHFRQIDWTNVENTKDLERLATCDPITCASIDFEFPPDVNYPSLPVEAGEYGLIYTRTGSTTAPGPELLVAKNQGASITIRAGARLNWLDRDGERPFAKKARGVNEERAKARLEAGGESGSAKELLAKEKGNSAYGKLAQGVSGMKTQPRIRNVYNPRIGQAEPLGPSSITAPHLAAYTSGLPRAVLSEILACAPEDALILSATTDGFISSMTLEQAASVCSAPAAQHFSDLRLLVSPDNLPDVLEKKHAAKSVLSAKTRGNFTVEPAEIKPGELSKYLCARAGHRLDTPIEDDKSAEIAEWLRIYEDRDFDTMMQGNVYASLREQCAGNSDLFDIVRASRANFDFDMKRRPINVRDGLNGLIKFETAPWDSLEEFLEWRGDFDAWRVATRSCLKVAADWDRFVAWRSSKRIRSAGRRSPWQQYLLTLFACGRVVPLKKVGRRSKAQHTHERTYAEISSILTAAGVPEITPSIVRMAAQREAQTLDQPPPPMLKEDAPVLESILKNAVTDVANAVRNILAQLSSDDHHLISAHANSQYNNVLNYNDNAKATNGIEINGANSVEGREYLRCFSNVANPLVETPLSIAPVSPPHLKDPRHNSAAVADAMNNLIPHLETQLRRQGVTGRHLKLGRIAAAHDGTPIQDQPMAGLALALSIKDDLPIELAVIMIAAMISPMPIIPARTVAHGGQR